MAYIIDGDEIREVETFPTWGAAKEKLAKDAEEEVERIEAAHCVAVVRMNKFKAMEKPGLSTEGGR